MTLTLADVGTRRGGRAARARRRSWRRRSSPGQRVSLVARDLGDAGAELARHGRAGPLGGDPAGGAHARRLARRARRRPRPAPRRDAARARARRARACSIVAAEAIGPAAGARRRIDDAARYGGAVWARVPRRPAVRRPAARRGGRGARRGRGVADPAASTVGSRCGAALARGARPSRARPPARVVRGLALVAAGVLLIAAPATALRLAAHARRLSTSSTRARGAAAADRRPGAAERPAAPRRGGSSCRLPARW